MESFSFYDEFVRHPDDSFLITVRGDSMVNAGIWDGDLLLIDKSLEPSTGDIVIASINREFTLKTLDLTHRDEGYIELVPANPMYPVFRVTEKDDFSVVGVLVCTLRRMHREHYSLGSWMEAADAKPWSRERFLKERAERLAKEAREKAEREKAEKEQAAKGIRPSTPPKRRPTAASERARKAALVRKYFYPKSDEPLEVLLKRLEETGRLDEEPDNELHDGQTDNTASENDSRADE